ncbi:hypothetical protein ABZY09_22585 [Streptomyces sp. NPDC002928]|uniref:hypothetical protein n=1 Tax=Streptomyces sp. NPDC002928 TaxID=3154440 RepID=UPI0033ACD88B
MGGFGWDGHSSDSGSEHEPSEESGRATWAAEEDSTPPWASAETQTGGTLPPPWAPPPTGAGGTSQPPWAPPPTGAGGALPPPWAPAPMYAPAPAPARSHGAARLLLVLTATVVLGAGTGAGVWYLARDHSSATGTTPHASVSVTSSPPAVTPSASAPVSPSASAAPGYRTARDPIGYTIAVPEGWTRRQKQGEKAPVVYYDSPDDGRQLQIFALAERTPAESLDLAENDPGYGFARQPGYRALVRRSDTTWSELTYRYDDADNGPRQVIDHRFRAADGTLYAIRVSGPEDLARALVREPLTTAVASFCPPGGACA